MRRRRLERERGKAAFQNRFLAQDIVHDREMASQRRRAREGEGERHAVHLQSSQFGWKSGNTSISEVVTKRN